MSKLDITYRGTVHQWHCDHMGHMNVMWYVGKFDEATWNLGRDDGHDGAVPEGHERGMAAVDQRISYRREALAGDVVTVRTAMIEVKPKLVRFVHEMRRGDAGDLLAVMMVDRRPHRHGGAQVDRVRAPHPAEGARDARAGSALWDQWPPKQGLPRSRKGAAAQSRRGGIRRGI